MPDYISRELVACASDMEGLFVFAYQDDGVDMLGSQDFRE